MRPRLSVAGVASLPRMTAMVALFVAALPAFAATVTVTGTGDTIAVDGLVTLREAITAINAGADVSDVVATGTYGVSDTIAFSIGSGVQTISPTSFLPNITKPVSIDGTTQPGFTGTPIIVLNGVNSAATSGIFLNGGSSGVRGLVIQGFLNAGIIIFGTGENVIAGNFIGTDVTASSSVPNGYGVVVQGSGRNVIGGFTPADLNVISGNTRLPGFGILALTGNTVIVGNRIGTNLTGTAAIPNFGDGIFLSSGSGSKVGGTALGSANVISGNGDAGIDINQTGVTVEGNFIGTNASGTAAIPNNKAGVRIKRDSNVIGGPGTASRNIISGNGDAGVRIDEFNENNSVLNNFIGTDVTGSASVPNFYGVYVDWPRNTRIGDIGAGNVISGNLSTGIAGSAWPFGPVQAVVRINGNMIGTDASGLNPLPNMGNGIVVSGNGVIVGGGPGEVNAAPNLIAFNAGNGIAVAGEFIPLFNNSIFSNGGLAIDLGTNGRSLNDHNDFDNLQNFPVILSASFAGGVTSIQYSLNSRPNSGFQIDLFRNPSCGFFERGEGHTRFSTSFVTTDSSGHAFGSVSVPQDLSRQILTALATSALGETSEFSDCLLVQGAPPSPSRSPNPSPTATPGPGGGAPANPIPTVSFPGLAIFAVLLAAIAVLITRQRF